MKKEIIFVSKMQSDKLYKDIRSHIDNNPLIISRFNPRSGKHIGTSIGNNLSNLVSGEHADYYFIVDLAVHELTQLDPQDITAFVLANAHKSLNTFSESNVKQDISLVLFDFIMDSMVIHQLDIRKIKSFP